MKRQVLITADEVEEWMNNLGTIVAFDVETNNTVVYSDLKLKGISFCDGNLNFYIDFNYIFEQDRAMKSIYENLKRITLLAAHNIPFDLSVLWKSNLYSALNCEFYDTMVADHLIDERRKHSLKYLANNQLGHDTVEYDEATRNPKKWYEYALNDSLFVYELMNMQKPKLVEKGLKDLFRNIEMPFQEFLMLMKVYGVAIDNDKFEKIREELKKSEENLTVEIMKDIGARYSVQVDLFGNTSNVVTQYNLKSNDDLSYILFDMLGLKPVYNTPGGKRGVGKESLESLKNEHPIVPKILKYKIVQKLLTAFFEPLPDFIQKDGKIRPDFFDTGTKTGRLSCARPNFQQLPKPNKDFPVETRALFTAPEGYKMIACDYAGQELRVLAHVSQDEQLIDIFNKGKDMHLTTANDFFDLGIPEEKLFSNHPQFEKLKDKYKSERHKAKTINFGMAYGKSAFGFANDFGISEDEAQKILDKYFCSFPGVKEAMNACKKQLFEYHYVATEFGRRRRFIPETDNRGNKYHPNSHFREAFNFLIQGFSADMIRVAANKTLQLSEKFKYMEVMPIMTVHDEIVYIVKEEYAQEAADKIKEAFENSVQLSVPVVADVSIGNNYYEVK